MKVSITFTRKLNKLLHAAYFKANRGTYAPEEWYEIDHEYKLAKTSLLEYVAALEARVPTSIDDYITNVNSTKTRVQNKRRPARSKRSNSRN